MTVYSNVLGRAMAGHCVGRQLSCVACLAVRRGSLPVSLSLQLVVVVVVCSSCSQCHVVVAWLMSCLCLTVSSLHCSRS